MCACMCVWVCVWVCVCGRVRGCLELFCICVYMHVVCVCLCMYVCKCMFVSMSVYLYRRGNFCQNPTSLWNISCPSICDHMHCVNCVDREMSNQDLCCHGYCLCYV